MYNIVNYRQKFIQQNLNNYSSCISETLYQSLPISFFPHSISYFSILFVPSNYSSMKVKVTQSCPTLCDLKNYTVHGILQARILEWIAFPFSRRSFEPRSSALLVDCLPTELRRFQFLLRIHKFYLLVYWSSLFWGARDLSLKFLWHFEFSYIWWFLASFHETF